MTVHTLAGGHAYRLVVRCLSCDRLFVRTSGSGRGDGSLMTPRKHPGCVEHRTDHPSERVFVMPVTVPRAQWEAHLKQS